jgi:anti-sigma B factor antagonist
MFSMATGPNLSPEAIEQYRVRLRYKVSYHLGGFCADTDDIVQESMSRFLVALQNNRIRNTDFLGAFLSGICNHVMQEYHRRVRREPLAEPMAPGSERKVMPEAELLETRDAIDAALAQLSSRDQAILHAFYLEEKSKEEICQALALTDPQFRVVLFRAKDRSEKSPGRIEAVAMSVQDDRLAREEAIRDYLLRRLDADTTEALESQYLDSQECFEELLAARAIMTGLQRPRLEMRRAQDVTVLEFTAPASLTRAAPGTEELHHVFDRMREQSDTRVLIDLSRVTRVDSSGLGALMACYSHAVRRQGILKLLNPNPQLRRVLHITKIDSVLELYENEQEALQSFAAGDR